MRTILCLTFTLMSAPYAFAQAPGSPASDILALDSQARHLERAVEEGTEASATRQALGRLVAVLAEVRASNSEAVSKLDQLVDDAGEYDSELTHLRARLSWVAGTLGAREDEERD